MKTKIECPRCRTTIDSEVDQCPVCGYDFQTAEEDRCPFCQSVDIRGDQTITWGNVPVKIDSDSDDIFSIDFPPPHPGDNSKGSVEDSDCDNIHCDRCYAEIDKDKSIEEHKWYLSPGEYQKLKDRGQVLYPCGTYPRLYDIVYYGKHKWEVIYLTKDTVCVKRWDDTLIYEEVSIQNIAFVRGQDEN